MGKANCGGLVLDSSSLITVDNIITTPGSAPTKAVKANCGGVQFDGDIFKNINGVITDVDAEPETVEGFLVDQPGCGGVILDSNCFELNENNAVAYTDVKPKYNLKRTETNCAVVVTRGEQAVSDGDKVLTQGDVITISTTYGEDYELSSLKVNGSNFTDGDTLTVSKNVNIVAVAELKTFDLSRTVDGCTLTVKRNGEAVLDGEGVLSAGDVISFEATPSEEGATLDTFEINGQGADIDTPLTVTEDVVINVKFVVEG